MPIDDSAASLPIQSLHVHTTPSSVQLMLAPPVELPPEAEAVETDVEAARRGLEDLFNLY